ncbi:MAG: kelch repeat-containing protein [Acidobacteriota bacterium]
MKDQGWQQVDKVFQAAVELEAVARSAFLDLACADDPILRSEVESLLTADSQPWDLIDTQAIESAAILLEDEQTRLTPGEEVGHYEILKLIGKGGMGEVYLARDRILNRNIALKLLPFYYTQNEDRLRRFQREAQAASALNHPNIITIHELGSVNDQQFIATELIEGGTLREHIARGPMPLTDAVEIAIQTARALAAAHRAGIVHRDVKPENIMLRPDGYVKVLDFGLAKLAEEPGTHSEREISTVRADVSSGILMGTLRYMSPEQALGLQVDARSDLFSLGVVLYEMVSGRPPFDARERSELVESILKSDPPVLGIYADRLPESLAAVAAKMLAKEPELRYQTADELITDLNLFKAELALADKRPEFARRPPRPAMALAIVLAVASVIGYASFRFLRSSTAAEPLLESLNDAGTWTTKAPISSPRWQAEPAVLNGVLYVTGGWNVCTPFADLESYDPEADAWTQRAPMQTARGAHGVGALSGKLYAVGGSTDCGNEIADVEAYDPTTNSWTAMASLPTARQGHAVAVSKGKLYAIGGRSSGTQYQDLNSEYDPQSDTWTDRAPMPTARSNAAVAVVNGIIYVLGGGDDSRALATVEAYDPNTDSWTPRRSMLAPRSDLAVAEINGIIYAFAGNGNSGQVEAYDPANDTWAVVARMPFRRSNAHAAALHGSIYFAGGSDQALYTSSVIVFTPKLLATRSGVETCPTLHITAKAPIPTARSGMAAGEIGGIIYVAGGSGDTSERFLATNEAYDQIADTWAAKAPMPTEREMRGSNNAVVDGMLYAIGGNSKGYCTNLNEAYDPKTDSWSTRAPMPTPRCHLAVVALGGLIYALGGTNTNGSIKYATVEIYDPSTDTWTAAPSMPTGRQDLGAVGLNGILYTVGGWEAALSHEMLDVVESYDPVDKTWTSRAPMPTPRSGMFVGVLKGLLIAVGGGTNETVFTTVESYDPVSDTWTILPNLPTPLVFSAAVTMNNTLYAIGGRDTNDNPGLITTNTAFSLTPCSNPK